MYVATMTTNMNNENVISLLFPMGIILPLSVSLMMSTASHKKSISISGRFVAGHFAK